MSPVRWGAATLGTRVYTVEIACWVCVTIEVTECEAVHRAVSSASTNPHSFILAFTTYLSFKYSRMTDCFTYTTCCPFQTLIMSSDCKVEMMSSIRIPVRSDMSLMETFVDVSWSCNRFSKMCVQYDRYETFPRSDKGFSGEPVLPSRLVSSYERLV